MVILTIIILTIHERGVSFQLFVSSSISFIIVLQFYEYRSFTSLFRFIPKYFILFDEIVSGIVFLISLSDSLLFMYRNATDFCILILYPETLLNSLMNCSSFLVAYLGFSMYCIIPSANSDTFTSSLPIWIPFIYFSCLIAVARTSNTMLNKSSECRHPCHVPDLRGKALSFSPLSMMLAVNFVIKCLYYAEVRFPYTHFVQSF